MKKQVIAELLIESPVKLKKLSSAFCKVFKNINK